MPKIRDSLYNVDIYEGFELVPHRYDLGHDPGGGGSDLFTKLVGQIRPSVIVEVGTWLGGASITMAKAARDLGLDCEIVCIDTWLTDSSMYRGGVHECMASKHGYPQMYYYFLSNVVKHGVQDYITPLPLQGEYGAQALKEREVLADLIYLDAGHHEEYVRRDIENFLPLLRPGGTIFGDDYYVWGTGVAQAVDREFGNNIWRYDWDGSDERLRKDRFWVRGPKLGEG